MVYVHQDKSIRLDTDWEPTPFDQSGITFEKAPAVPPATNIVKPSGPKVAGELAVPVGSPPGGFDPLAQAMFDLVEALYK